MGFRPQRSVALETLELCASLRERIAEAIPSVQPVVWVAVAAAICARQSGSTKKLNPMADLNDAEYRRRYELGRRRFYAERAERKAQRQAWLREHGPWLLLSIIAVLLVAVLGVTRPHSFIVMTTLALYGVLAWAVCWAVRASC